MAIVVIGSRGSDAGYWELVGGKLVHVPGWNPEALAEVVAAATMLAQAPALKTPEIGNRVEIGRASCRERV